MSKKTKLMNVDKDLINILGIKYGNFSFPVKTKLLAKELEVLLYAKNKR